MIQSGTRCDTWDVLRCPIWLIYSNGIHWFSSSSWVLPLRKYLYPILAKNGGRWTASRDTSGLSRGWSWSPNPKCFWCTCASLTLDGILSWCSPKKSAPVGRGKSCKCLWLNCLFSPFRWLQIPKKEELFTSPKMKYQNTQVRSLGPCKTQRRLVYSEDGNILPFFLLP